MLHAIWRQSARSPRCPDTPPLTGRLALVTGGSRGIGLETSRGLAARGAEVISAARDEDAGKRASEALRAQFGLPAHFVPLDLGDLRALSRTRDALDRVREGRRVDLLVANAGFWPRRHALSPQGHEIAFATNLLGHHALVRSLLDRDAFAAGARIVVLTGDIYVMARECTADFSYRGTRGGMLAYCRSKLGNLWYVRQLARRHPELRVHAVHPGVVATDLGGRSDGATEATKRRLLLSPEQGAQTSLFCATQPDLASGSYYHNTLGRVELSPDDPAADDARAEALFDLLERLVSRPGAG